MLLAPGDRVRVIAPSLSLSSICKTPVEKASYARCIERLESLGLEISFGQSVWEEGPLGCASVGQRLEDLHQAFADPGISGVLTVIGGWNANQLLDHIDYALIAANPKVFCGYSDITVLHGAFQAKAGLQTFYGPHFSAFGMEQGIAYTLQSFQRALMEPGSYEIQASTEWSEDAWFVDQETRRFTPNPGLQVLQPGAVEATVLGGHLTTLHLLQGTPYMPDLAGKLLFIEDHRGLHDIDRTLQSLLQSPAGAAIAGLVIGRFPSTTGATREALQRWLSTKPALRGKPVVYGLDLGHTTPHTCLPLGGRLRVEAEGEARVTVVRDL